MFKLIKQSKYYLEYRNRGRVITKINMTQYSDYYIYSNFRDRYIFSGILILKTCLYNV